jgi:hypothetical protein
MNLLSLVRINLKKRLGFLIRHKGARKLSHAKA